MLRLIYHAAISSHKQKACGAQPPLRTLYWAADDRHPGAHRSRAPSVKCIVWTGNNSLDSNTSFWSMEADSLCRVLMCVLLAAEQPL
ncbi:hypothetical protein E2C01_048084 [Portunus trituberculatus]|uniref:Uncharacterized protein n=1 Tax=Portunus trituberculatus TaxID=210409 RepID=A0A5B7G9L3_PORTR|nr:hypothetical protein [Portunus trituberculatus]